MRTSIVFIIISISCFGTAKAQSFNGFFDMDAYRHTLIQDGSKITFFTKTPSKESYPKVDRTYFWYANNTLNATQGGFDGKLLNGPYNEYFTNKNLKLSGILKDGLRVGCWKSWSETGVLKEVLYYRKGLMDGKYFKYNSQGILEEQRSYKAGKLHGKYRYYLSNDSIKIDNYKNGKLSAKSTPKNLGMVSRMLKKIKTFKTKGS